MKTVGIVGGLGPEITADLQLLVPKMESLLVLDTMEILAEETANKILS